MKMRTLLCGLLVIGAMVLFMMPVVAQEKESGHTHKEGDAGHQHGEEMDAAMQAWAKMAAPGKFHEYLQPLVGTWGLSVEWKMFPSDEFETHKGTCAYKWILGGRFLLEKVKGEAMEEGGELFEGMGITGYDNQNKQYTSIWIDTMSTATYVCTGTGDESGKVFTFYGEETDPMTGQKIKTKSVLRIVSSNKLVCEMYRPGPDGKEFKNMEITYQRK